MYRTRPMTRNKLAAAIFLSALAQPITIICLQCLCSNRPIDECKLTDAQGLHIVNMGPPFKPPGNGADHRDEAGRFVRGCAPGPGRPNRSIETAYLKVLLTEVSLDMWAQIVNRAARDAAAGDAKAREWIARYVIGSPDYQAPRPFDVAVEDEAGIDAVANAAFLRKAQGPF